MTTQQYGNWDIKQLLDIISKGVNSVLITKPDTPPDALQNIAHTLLKIYTEIYRELKGNQQSPTQDMPFFETNNDEEKL